MPITSRNKLTALALAAALFFPLTIAQLAAQAPASQPHDPWWKHGIIYEVYPRSFQDTNGDGIGDINGITSRLGYLQSLGIDAIWITPMYPSPQVDFGYDISNYTAIDPLYGTMADFDHLMVEAKQHHIRVIMDYVPNHTSDQNAWFKKSRSSRTNPKRTWYIWNSGIPASTAHLTALQLKNEHTGPSGKVVPPNNWQSWFGGSAWQWDSGTKQFYYHYFYVQQPDLNWRNPEVQKAMLNVLRFWMNKGVSGFRIDAVSRLFEDPQLRNDPSLPGTNAFGDPNIVHKYTDDLPEVHDMLRAMRAVVNKYPGDPVLISEADEPTVADLSKMYGKHNDEVQLPMDFQVADINQLSVAKFRTYIDQVEHNPAHGQPYFFFGNHDQDRLWDRYSAGVTNPAMKERIARIMATLLLTSRCTPQLYYGDEIGMVTTTPTRKQDVKDPEGITGWPKEKGRDGERTPMQWSASKDAGFSTAAKTWLPIPPSYFTTNVKVESAEPNSLLNWYKRLIELRRTNPALIDGTMKMIATSNNNILAYIRTAAGHTVLVAMNFTGKRQDLDLHEDGGNEVHTLSTDDPNLTNIVPHKILTLAPYATYIGEAK
ncbi:MAG: alpha-amylase family glycosyl hydrolase [Acidobacteriaceae bacterium]